MHMVLQAEVEARIKAEAKVQVFSSSYGNVYRQLPSHNIAHKDPYTHTLPSLQAKAEERWFWPAFTKLPLSVGLKPFSLRLKI